MFFFTEHFHRRASQKYAGFKSRGFYEPLFNKTNFEKRTFSSFLELLYTISKGFNTAQSWIMTCSEGIPEQTSGSESTASLKRDKQTVANCSEGCSNRIPADTNSEQVHERRGNSVTCYVGNCARHVHAPVPTVTRRPSYKHKSFSLSCFERKRQRYAGKENEIKR